MRIEARKHKAAQRTLVIREAKVSDITTLTELARVTYTDAFGHSFSEADLSAHLEKHLSPSNFALMVEEDVVLLALAEDHLVGYVQFGALKSVPAHPADRELRRLYVRREFQNAGYGGALMEAALRHKCLKSATNIYLDVWEHNLGAQRFYERYGFQVIGTNAFLKASGVSDSLDLVMVRRSFPKAEPTKTVE